MYTICKIKNISGDTATLHGKQFNNNEIYQIPDAYRIDWSDDDNVIVAIANENFEILDSDNSGLNSITEQLDLLNNKIPIEMIPTTPKNEHTLTGLKYRIDEFTPTSDGEGGYLSHKTNYKMDCDTHIGLRIWGSKMKYKYWHEDDYVKVRVVDIDNVLGYGANFVLAEFIDWYIEPEEGIFCARPPDGCPNLIYNDLYLQHEWFPQDATARKGWVNLVFTKHEDDVTS